MPIELQNLDDRTFADLVAEGVRMIPGLAPAWTDHNPSDPGITLIELFASVAEQLIYRVNRVSDANKHQFLKLLAGADSLPAKGQSIDDALHLAVLDLAVEDRVVTRADYETLAAAVPGVGRAHCMPRRNLDATAATNIDAPGHVSMIIVPSFSAAEDTDDAAQTLTDRLMDAIAPQCLAGTQLHLRILRRGHPSRVRVGVRLSLTIYADRRATDIAQAAIKALHTFLNPLTGGTDGKGWPLGRALYVSDIYALMDGVDGVDHVTPGPVELRLADAELSVERRLPPGTTASNWIGLSLLPGELLEFDVDPSLSRIDIVSGVSEQPGR